jgi:hypothetical protein
MDEIKREILDRCLYEEPAFCAAACPLGLDVPDFLEKLQRGSFSAAYRTYRNTVVFPDIVSRLCGAPCAEKCVRRDRDAPVALPLLERAAVEHAPSRKPNRYSVSEKPGRIAVIGAGASGLACALRLASFCYDVTVYEKSGRIGGRLWELLEPAVFLEEFQREFAHVTYTLKLETEIRSLDEVSADAVYAATGAGGENFGLRPGPGPAWGTNGVFLGGGLRGADTVGAVADGLLAAKLLENYLKTGVMPPPSERRDTRLPVPAARLNQLTPAFPPESGDYSKEEAVNEANRCLRCRCDACLRGCDLMEYYRKLPPRLAGEVYSTVHPCALFGNETYAKRIIGSCNQCGACKAACPLSLDTGGMFREGKRLLRDKEKLSWALHEFWLRDMEHANGRGGLVRRPPSASPGGLAFFPGCQLGAVDPRYVLESYAWIRGQDPGAALWLGCCGIPAVWAGETALTASAVRKLRGDWLSLESPELIFACPSCKKCFAEFLPEVNGRFLTEWMAERGFAPPRRRDGAGYAVFDPCASRGEPALQKSVRRLAESAGIRTEELAYNGEDARCCSWGGHVDKANPDYAKAQKSKRVGLSPLPYITYCVNCRELFADAGKPCVHILDLLFDLGEPERPAATCTVRRDNREALRERALRLLWNESSALPPKGREKLVLSEELSRKLSDGRILEEDVLEAIEACERSGRTATNPETGNKTGHTQIGRSTLWVVYRPENGRFRLFNAYQHRMRICAEDMWNGRKVDYDM